MGKPLLDMAGYGFRVHAFPFVLQQDCGHRRFLQHLQRGLAVRRDIGPNNHEILELLCEALTLVDGREYATRWGPLAHLLWIVTSWIWLAFVQTQDTTRPLYSDQLRALCRNQHRQQGGRVANASRDGQECF